MDRSFKAIEDNLANCTLWNYTVDNSNERGDLWNDEDFSIFSHDQQINIDDIHSGGRALEAVVWPYAKRVAGEPLRMSFDLKTGVFEFDFKHDPSITEPTEIFVPNLQYPEGISVTVTDGEDKFDHDRQRLYYSQTNGSDMHWIKISPL